MTTIRLLDTIVPSLRFESDEDERVFAETAYPQWLKYSTVGGLLALVFNNAFLLMDYMISPAVFEVGLHIRFYLCTTFGLFVFASGAISLYRPTPIPRVVQEGLVVAASVLAGLSILLVAMLSPIHGTMWGIFYHAGLVPILVFASVMMRLRFRAVCALAAALLLMHWTALALSPPVPGAPVTSMMLTVGAPSLFMLIFSYQFEVANRHRFMQKRRAAVLRDQLHAKRVALEQATQSDPLTGALNRRGFGVFMDELRARAQADGHAYALALIDVDHFKRYNDGYGHPAGDECLRAVAKVLMRVAAEPGGVLARWGGEEFVMAWPENDAAADPLAMGEGLCEAVAALALPHAHSDTAPVVTVSVGVSSSAHLPDWRDWQGVLAQADAGLYQAKREGRHRAGMVLPPSSSWTT
ncbi:MAG: diguanylate cyclase [Aquabacterium sp.]